MIKAGASVHTSYGPGTVTEVETSRGHTQVRVAGNGFNVWLDQAKVHYVAGLESTIEPGTPYHVQDNSTVLPYNPDPQHHNDLFRHEQTIQPGEYEIDRDDRLHPSDSVSFDDKSGNRPYPGPNPDLFAKSSAYYYYGGPLGEGELGGHGEGGFGGGIMLPTPTGEGQYSGTAADRPFQPATLAPPMDMPFASKSGSYYYADNAGVDPSDPTLAGAQGAQQVGPPSVTNTAQGEAGIDRGLFPGAFTAGYHYADLDDEPSRPDWGDDDWHEGLPDGPERTLDKNAAYYYGGGLEEQGHEGGSEESVSGNGFIPAQPSGELGGMTHGPGFSPQQLNVPEFGNTIATPPPARSPSSTVSTEPPMGPLAPKPPSLNTTLATYRPAGLSDRYAFFDIEAETHPGNDLARFRSDPLSFIAARGHLFSDGDESLYHKYADYTHLLGADRHEAMRTVAEVAKKSEALCREGRVAIQDRGSHRIYAMVAGDTGTYHTMVARSEDGIANWHCGCEWGRWAFANQMNQPHHLCAHARAAYLCMPRIGAVTDDFASWLKETNRTPDDGAVSDYIHTVDNKLSPDEVQKLYDYCDTNPAESPERKYDVGYENDPDKVYKSADMLRLRPQSLTPNIHEVPKGEDEKFVDVTKDERETTGPDDIVHFSSKQLIASLHTADTPAPGPGQPGYVPGAGPPAEGAGNDAYKGLGDKFKDFFNNSKGLGLVNPALGLTNWMGNLVDTHNVGQHPDLVSGGQPQKATDVSATSPANGFAGKPTAPGSSAAGAGAAPGPGAQPPGAAGPALQPGQTRDPDGTVHATNPNLNPSMVKNTIGGEGLGSADKGTLGTGSGYGGAGFQGPDGSGQWQKSNETTGITGDSYEVKSGDTLHDIAQRSGQDVNSLAQHNNISNPDLITPGQKINIPGGGKGNGMPDPSSIPAGDPKEGEAPAPGYRPPGLSGTPGVNSGQVVGQPPAPPKVPSATSPATPAAPTPPTPPAPPSTPGLADKGNSALKTKTSRRRYADEDTRPSTGEAAGMLDELRDLSQQDPHLQHMDEHNEKVSDLVERLQDAGVDASYFVASLHTATPTYPTDPGRPPSNSVGPGGTPPPVDNPAKPPGLLETLPPNLTPDFPSPNINSPAQELWPQIPGMLPGGGPMGTGLIPGLLQPQNNVPSQARPEPNPAAPTVPGQSTRVGSYVASLHTAVPQGQRSDDDPSDGDANFAGMSNPNWADEPFAGSGADPKFYMSDSASYVDDHERPDFSPEDWYKDDGSDIIKFNDSRSSPQQGPRNASLLHYALDPNDESSGMFNPANPTGNDWEQASGEPFMDEVGKQVHNMTGQGVLDQVMGKGGGGAAGEAGEAGLAEEAPELMALARVQRHGGPRQQVRVDRRNGWEKERVAAALPEDFGYNGGSSLEDFSVGDEMGGGGDILANFQRSGAAAAMMVGSGGSNRGNDDIAQAAQAFLRTAGRKYTPEEQRMLEAEAHPMGARNLPTDDDLAGTHYIF